MSVQRWLHLSIAAALATIGLKTLAWWLTGSVGLLSDAAESVVNLVAAVGALVLTWGWPLVAGSASVRGSRVALAVAGLGMAAVMAAVEEQAGEAARGARPAEKGQGR